MSHWILDIGLQLPVVVGPSVVGTVSVVTVVVDSVAEMARLI